MALLKERLERKKQQMMANQTRTTAAMENKIAKTSEY